MTGVRVRELQDRSNARIALALAAVIIFALLLAWNEHHDRPYGREQQHLTSGAARPSNRDATTRPGWRDSDGNWVVAASPNGGGGAMHGFYRRFMERAKEGGVEQLEWARGRSVLFIGDSVLRDIVIQFCVNLKVDLREYDIFGDEHEEKDEKHLSWECIVPEVGLAWRSNMMFGLTQYDALPDFEEASAGLDWPAPPHDMDSRMKQLLPSLKSSPPDMLVVNMGAWDFKWMYRRDLFHHRKHDSIPQADLVEFAARLRLYFGLLQEACPTSKLVWMEMHPFSSNDTRAKWFWSAGLLPDVPDLRAVEPFEHELFPPLFTRHRVAQLASTYRAVAQDMGIATLDYAAVANAMEPGEFIRKGDAIHPSTSSIRTISDLVLEKLWVVLEERGSAGVLENKHGSV